VRRQRPRLRRLPPLASAPSALSFPSAHATASLAAATAMGRVEPRARLPLYGLAVAISLTRPYLGMHYPSDVLAGAALGLALGGSWPGLRGRGTEDRLIDLVADAARSAAGSVSGDSEGNGHRPAGPPPADRESPAHHEGPQAS
jgi:membrane-associated phospholipid phosphatase